MPRVELVYWIMMERLKFDAWYDDLEGRKCTQKDYA